MTATYAEPVGRLRSAVELSGAMASGVGMQAVLAVSGVLAARMLGPSDRGTLALFVVIPSIISQIGAIGLSVAGTYFISRNRAEARHIIRLLKVPAFLQTGVLFAVHVCVLVIIFHGHRHVLSAALLSLALVPSTLALDYGLAFLQGVRRLSLFNLLRLAPNTLYSFGLLGVFLVGSRGLTLVTGIVVGAWVTAGAVVLAVGLREVRRQEAAPGTAVDLRALFSFGWRSAIGTVSTVDSFRLDQILVAALLSTRLLGIYVVAVAFTNLPRFVCQSIGAIAFPRLATSSNPRRDTRRYLVVAGGASALVVAVLLPTMPWLVGVLFGSRFLAAVNPARILVSGALFLGLRRVISDAARGRGKPALGSIGEAGTLVTFLVLAPLMANQWALEGMAAAYSLGAVVGLAAVTALARRTGL